MHIIDLTLQMDNELLGMSLTQHTTVAVEGYNILNVAFNTHTGTHLDAPRHFIDGAASLNTMPLAKCVGEALIVDLSHKEPRSLITIDDLMHVADRIGQGTRLLLRTDWDLRAHSADYRTHFPRISLELAEWLAERGIWLLGLEHPSVAALDNLRELTDVHQALLRSEIVIVESLANLRELPETVTFVALPLKLKDGDGSPVRAIAIVE